jgi:galactose mutarotase-like enzyme
MVAGAGMKVDVEHGLTRLTLENDELRVQVWPEVGGKISSVQYVPGKHEFLLQPSQPAEPYRIPGYGAPFKDFNSGFDECLPTVAACRYPGGNFTGELPDHGEVWSVPWGWQCSGESIELRCRGTHLPFVFEKTLRLKHSRILISYTLQNTSAQDVYWLWSAHPLLSVRPGDRILLPPEVKQLFVDQSHTGRLGTFGNCCNWPLATGKDGAVYDLSRLEAVTAGTAEKYFTPRLSQGWCALDSPSAGYSICYRFDPAKVPFVGIWVNQGGWPPNAILPHYTVALEPSNGAPDSLEKAAELGQANILGGWQIGKWDLEIELQAGPPRL